MKGGTSNFFIASAFSHSN